MYLCGPLLLGGLARGFLRRNDKIPLASALVWFLGYIAITYVAGLFSTGALEKVLGVDFKQNCVWAALNLPWSLLFGSNITAFN
jgi:hypothetical protein